MKDVSVTVQIIKTYNITVPAKSAKNAEEIVRAMDSLDIAEQGSLKSVDVDYVEANVPEWVQPVNS